MPYTPIIGTLGYVIDRANDTVLLVHRNKRAGDEHLGKWNGLGGKLEPGEDLAAGMRRELLEEAHIHVRAMTLRGTISWPGFGANGEDWLGPIFLVEQWDGTPPTSNAEGDLAWVLDTHTAQGAAGSSGSSEVRIWRKVEGLWRLRVRMAGAGL